MKIRITGEITPEPRRVGKFIVHGQIYKVDLTAELPFELPDPDAGRDTGQDIERRLAAIPISGRA